MLSHFSSVWFSFSTPWTRSCQAHVSMGFSRQEYWSGLPYLLQGIFLSQRSNPHLLHLLHWQAGSLPLASPGKQDSTLKSRDIILLTKVHRVKAMVMVFPVVMYGWLNIQKKKIVASGPITSWQIDGETMETVTDFIFLGSKITADSNCSHEIKRHFSLEGKLWQT